MTSSKVVVPDELIDQFLDQIHHILGHPGIFKTIETLKKYFTFINFKERITKQIRSCLCCAKEKSNFVKFDKIIGYLDSKAPLTKISTDLYGPLEFIGNDHIPEKIHLLTITDIFARYSVVRPLTKIDTQQVINVLKEDWIDHFGAPGTMISDNGRQYTSREMKEFCRNQKIQHYFTCLYNPTSNAISERINQTIGNVVRINKEEKLDKIIELIENALNKTTNRSLGYTPEEALLKKSSIDPLGRDLSIENNKVLERVEKLGQDNIKRTNKNKRKFEIGDIVLSRTPRRLKLDSFWDGPYSIVSFSRNRNKIEIEKNLKRKWVNVKQLKLFKSKR